MKYSILILISVQFPFLIDYYLRGKKKHKLFYKNTIEEINNFIQLRWIYYRLRYNYTNRIILLNNTFSKEQNYFLPIHDTTT